MCGSGADGSSRTARLKSLTAISRCPRSICVLALLERAARPRPEDEATDCEQCDEHGAERGEHPHRESAGRRHDLDWSGSVGHVRNRFHLAGHGRRTARQARTRPRRFNNDWLANQRRVQLQHGLTRRIQIGVGWTIGHVLQPIVHRLKLGERIGLVEVDELTLPRLANERLAGEDRASDENAERALHRMPDFDQIGGKIFGAAIAVEPRNGSARRIESRRAL